MNESLTADVVVAGGGMAGLVAAVAALERTEDVIVLEKGPRTGGSMYLSGGTVWTFETLKDVREVAPYGDPELQSIVVESLETDLKWLETIGVETVPILTDIDERWGREIDPEESTAILTETIEADDRVRRRTPMETVRTDERGRATQVVANAANGGYLLIEAGAVVLATGGFQGNEELVQRHITDHTKNLWLRSNPWSTGDGLLAARSVGGKATTGLGSFYGHNMAAPPAEISPREFVDVTQYYGPQGLALDKSGQRFVDESSHYGEEGIAVATAKDAGGRAYYLLDVELFESEFTNELRVGRMVERVAEHGGRTASAPSLGKLADAVENWDLDGDAMVRTVTEYNRAIRNDSAGTLDPPRRANRSPFDTPPFHVVELQPGITFTTGGIAVDAEMRVLSRARSSSTLLHGPAEEADLVREPIEGLYAAGVDIGNVHEGGYIGGLATALTTGRVAGQRAARYADQS
ncbi:FAD-dependent oxidoreductase [Saliphagus sp. LR7]|uniref:FAD-dependent oxidoreductase n=1 Tax=Saliphagus sp. LR7 TaxID=2282654 RepID=UPI000DF8046F|nr:FAD-dependent oxidoreductase [Saliphagus sp. LR7]